MEKRCYSPQGTTMVGQNGVVFPACIIVPSGAHEKPERGVDEAADEHVVLVNTLVTRRPSAYGLDNELGRKDTPQSVNGVPLPYC